MRKPKLSKRDFDLINLALDILGQDYSNEEAKYQVQTFKKIEKLKLKLMRIKYSELRAVK